MNDATRRTYAIVLMIMAMLVGAYVCDKASGDETYNPLGQLSRPKTDKWAHPCPTAFVGLGHWVTIPVLSSVEFRYSASRKVVMQKYASGTKLEQSQGFSKYKAELIPLLDSKTTGERAAMIRLGSRTNVKHSKILGHDVFDYVTPWPLFPNGKVYHRDILTMDGRIMRLQYSTRVKPGLEKDEFFQIRRTGRG